MDFAHHSCRCAHHALYNLTKLDMVDTIKYSVLHDNTCNIFQEGVGNTVQLALAF
jgi:hypothetical protein